MFTVFLYLQILTSAHKAHDYGHMVINGHDLFVSLSGLFVYQLEFMDFSNIILNQ